MTKQTNEDFVRLLEGSPAYQGIDVHVEYERLVIWCKLNRARPTQRRIIAWLNRIPAKPKSKAVFYYGQPFYPQPDCLKPNSGDLERLKHQGLKAGTWQHGDPIQ